MTYAGDRTDRSTSRHRAMLVGAATLAATLFGAAGAVEADVVNSLYFNSTIYNYKNVHMPDVDQRRTALPANGGMYCVPTAAFNIFAYAANHGFPDAAPGPGNWQNSNYIAANLWLNLIGDWMNTDPEDGTFGPGVKAGLEKLVEYEPFLKYVRKYKSNNYTPTAGKLANYACSGWAMSFVYGRYKVTSTHLGVPVVKRDGGHAVTLTRLYRAGENWNLRYRDPADDSANLSTQSLFANTSRTPWSYLAYYGGTAFSNLRSMTAIFSTEGGTRVIDSFYGVRPMFGISFFNSGDALGGGTLNIIDPLPFEGSPSNDGVVLGISQFLDVLDFDFDGDFQDAMLIAKSSLFVLPSRLRKMSLVDGTMTILEPSPQNLVRFATDRRGYIYTFDTGGKLYRLAEDGTTVNATSAIPSPTDVAVQDSDDTVWILSVPQRKIVKLSDDFSETLLTINIPTPVPMTGDAELRIHPVTGMPWFVTDANDTMYGISLASTSGPTAHPFTSPALTGVDSFSFGDNAELFVSGNGLIKVLKSATDISWTLDPGHPFHGQPGGTYLAMLRNIDNYDPIEHDGPEWRNLTKAELEENGPFVGDCAADLNGDDDVNGADVGLLLADWGATDRRLSDIDQNGIVDGSDLGILLSEWGFCP